MLYADPCIHRISNALCCIKQSGCAQPGANSSSCKTHQIARSQKHVHDLRQFRYDASKEVRENVSLTSTGTSSYFAGNTWYLNGEDSLGLTYEKEVRANGTTENKHYLMAGGQVFAVFTSRTGTLNGLAASTTSYFQHDQLGSIAVVTDENGVVKERLAYDPWGKRRNIMNSPGTPDTRDLLVGKYTNRGFTEHEHLDEIGMIHMNGRIYDPLIGRFMSADSLIEAPDQLASYNRYSYVWNNPLNRVDPSGFCWIYNPIGETFKTLNHIGDVIASDPVARTLVTVAIAYYTGQWATNSLGFSAIGSGALGGAASSAFASNGDINAIAVGAVTGAGFGWAGGVGGADSFARYAAHASVGCVSAVASGGSCGAGAASAVFGKYTTNAIGDIGGSGISAVIARGVATAVAGGVGAVIAGGSFENGARTAAFGYLFNELMHDKSRVNGKEFVLSNPHAMDELKSLNSAIIDLGYSDESFTIRITGGDRIIDSNGVIRSATDNTIVAGAAPNSRHLVTQGARGLDVQVSGVSASDFSKALAVTNLKLLNVTYGDGHKHLDLPATQWFAPRRKP